MQKEFERSFSNIANFAPAMFWITDINKLAVWFNQPWYDYTNRTDAQEAGFGWTEGIHPEDYQQCVDVYTIAFDARKSFSIDYRLRRHDGVYRWIMDSGNPVYAEDGTFSGYIGCCTDIQDRKDLELALSDQTRALQKSDAQLRASVEKSESLSRLYETILSATPDFVYIFEFGSNENEHRFGYANKGLLKMFGRSFNETVGKTFLEIGYEPWHADLHNKEIELVRTTKKPLRGEVPFNGTYGRRIYDYIFAPVFDRNGEVEAVAGITRDVTERHDTEEKLKRNEEALLLASKRKDEFLAMLAHELRNPLAPISAATQIMSLSNYDVVRVQKYSQVIERQVKHMVDLIDDLLDVSRVTRGLVEIKKSPQDLTKIIMSAVEQVKPLIESKQQRFSIEGLSDTFWVLGDEKRLIQIVANVLNNAAKFTQDQGEIKTDVWVQANRIFIAVIDNGIGITEADQEQVFELFAQAKRSSDRSQGGLGIGLALVESLLNLHGGKITCSSEGLGKGSQFVIELPLSAEVEVLQNNSFSQSSDISSLKIVIVDDNVDAANSLAEVLKLIGHEIFVEHEPLNGLELIFKVNPHICILDIGLPQMDGYEMAKRIRINTSFDDTYLIAVTGYGQENDKKNAKDSGFNLHLVKPVDLDQLYESIEILSLELLVKQK